jgi:hypothetical protein
MRPTIPKGSHGLRPLRNGLSLDAVMRIYMLVAFRCQGIRIYQ